MESNIRNGEKPRHLNVSAKNLAVETERYLRDISDYFDVQLADVEEMVEVTDTEGIKSKVPNPVLERQKLGYLRRFLGEEALNRLDMLPLVTRNTFALPVQAVKKLFGTALPILIAIHELVTRKMKAGETVDRFH